MWWHEYIPCMFYPQTTVSSDSIYISNTNKGWICPKCNIALAPNIEVCPYCLQKEISNNVVIKKRKRNR